MLGALKQEEQKERIACEGLRAISKLFSTQQLLMPD